MRSPTTRCLDPSDIPRYARMGIIANCTPLWGHRTTTVSTATSTPDCWALTAWRTTLPVRRSGSLGATVTYGSDIPRVGISEGPPLIQIEAVAHASTARPPR